MDEQAQFLYDTAQHMMKRAGNTRDPEEIAIALGAELLDEYDLKNLKGMYSSADRHRSIFIHCYLSRRVRRFVVAHELGHDQLHRPLARENPLQELQFFSCKAINTTEMEANIIAAHILIDEDDLPDYMQMGYTVPAIAAELEVPEDLLLIKIEQMIRLGYYNFKINEMYRKPRGNYLKDYKDDVDDFFCE